MGIRPGSNEKIERWTDIYFGILRTNLRALGGNLEEKVKIGGKFVAIESFEDFLSEDEQG